MFNFYTVVQSKRCGLILASTLSFIGTVYQTQKSMQWQSMSRAKSTKTPQLASKFTNKCTFEWVTGVHAVCRFACVRCVCVCAGVDMYVCSTMLFICVCIHTYAYCVSIMCTHVHVCVYIHSYCFAGQCHYDRMQCLWFCLLNWMLSGVWQELFVQCSEFNLG